MQTTICGKRTARFVCTLESGHDSQHGRAYRRQPKKCRRCRGTGSIALNGAGELARCPVCAK